MPTAYPSLLRNEDVWDFGLQRDSSTMNLTTVPASGDPSNGVAIRNRSLLPVKFYVIVYSHRTLPKFSLLTGS